MSPDILLGQEFTSGSAVTAFVNILNSAPGSPGDWAAAAFVDGPDSDNAFFYRQSVVSLATDYRDRVRIRLLVPIHTENVVSDLRRVPQVAVTGVAGLRF